jgi:hypothetical protein
MIDIDKLQSRDVRAQICDNILLFLGNKHIIAYFD